ncbi:hypothetical protein MSG28_014076 [Choristoneura fumiferana]|uniref:Uncharacterized protein n=1 Tax=Choristoneura fumiferana TaxID=7141 RepID=A0ACC0JFV0_CHOFU|nr:hypothetical protein MSG28_014076 [Choristoneura fumiferana]
MSQGKIVLMACGSFSPPTYMHLRMFEIARDYIHTLGLGTVVGGIMSPVHDAYGKKDLVAAHHRIAMLKLALRTSAWIKVSEWETQQAGWTRTKVSMQHHQDTINHHISRTGSDPPNWLPDDVLNLKLKLIKIPPPRLPGHSEYNILNDLIANYDKNSPQDVTMASPEETSFKNILISIRDKPTIIDETITVKRAKKSNYLMPNMTDTVSPLKDKPKMAYVDKVPASYVPGKAVKIVSGASQHSVNEVSYDESTYSSLDSYLTKDDCDYELYKRRVSEGNVEAVKNEPIKKRCSASTIRKLNKVDIKKSKSEVSKLCDKVKSIKLKERERNYKTRSCNDIVRLILTKHGIHVISDTEAIV